MSTHKIRTHKEAFRAYRASTTTYAVLSHTYLAYYYKSFSVLLLKHIHIDRDRDRAARPSARLGVVVMYNYFIKC